MDMAGIAIAVRDALVQSRDPDYIYNWVMVESNVMVKAANAGTSFPLFSHGNHLVVNSHEVSRATTFSKRSKTFILLSR